MTDPRKAALEALNKVEWCEPSCDGAVSAGFDCDDASDFLTKHHEVIRAALTSPAPMVSSEDVRAAFEIAYGAAWSKDDFATFANGMYNLKPDTDYHEPMQMHNEINQDWIAFQKGYGYASTAMGVENEKMRTALEKFANSENWMRNKMFDVNGTNFIGLTTAQKALTQPGEKS